MLNSRQTSVIASPSSRRATKRRRSSITELAFHGIHTSRLQKSEKCNPCVRYEMSPMSRAAHQAQLEFLTGTTRPAIRPGTRWGHIIVRHSAIKDQFSYETCRWSAGQPDQAKRWFDELELTLPQNVRSEERRVGKEWRSR